MYETIVIGGGPAGLSAALVLGRAKRRTLVVDAGQPRNAPAPAAHGLFTRDGTPPGELLRIAREQLAAYPSVEILHGEAVAAQSSLDGFAIDLASGETVSGRKLILAAGVTDELPPTPGFRDLWGKGIYHCPTATAGRCATNRSPSSPTARSRCTSPPSSVSGAPTSSS